ncbi:MAG: UbiA family prenyltransferase [Saprospiraceae bacterium]|nr:UbiA family prenyltransferase [Candidatus Vicinibacter proximus]MBL7823375.1 UbiA family prenyltransferase [Saprospiraceae bacterium]MCC6842406.1 UbiA family prenyltransferase [Saprospiraceae bacterium]
MKSYFSLVKFSHTVFALPFALIGFFVAVNNHELQPVQYKILALILVCMVTARNAAMAFNRWADRFIDQKNERTALREIPSGAVSSRSAIIFIMINVVLFILSAFFINPLCFYLSPVALFIVFGYSYTKRFSWLCHVFLGLGLSLAPIGAYIAVTSHIALLPLLYGFAVITWVAGFDVLYALQDIEFDRKEKLYSIPSRFGLKKALAISSVLHFVCALCILSCSFILYRDYGLEYWMMTGAAGFIFLLIYQHAIISNNRLDRINLAFFTTNGIASIFLATFTILDFYY